MKLSLMKSGMGVLILGVGLLFSHAAFATTSVTTLPVQPSQFQTTTGTPSGVATTTQLPQHLACGIPGVAKVSIPPVVAVKHQLYNIVQLNTTTSSHVVTPAPVTHTVHSFSERTSMATRTVTQIHITTPPATTHVNLIPHTQSVPVYRTLTSYVPTYRTTTKTIKVETYRTTTKTIHVPTYRTTTRTVQVPTYRPEKVKVPVYDHAVVDEEKWSYEGENWGVVGTTTTCRDGVRRWNGSCMYGSVVHKKWGWVKHYGNKPTPTRIKWIVGYTKKTIQVQDGTRPEPEIQKVQDGSRPEPVIQRVPDGTRPETITNRVQTGIQIETHTVQDGTTQIVTYSKHFVVVQPPPIRHVSTYTETYPVVKDVPITRVVQEQAPPYEAVSTHTTTQTLASEWETVSTQTLTAATTATKKVEGLCPVPTGR